VNFVSSGEDIFRKPRGRGKQFLAQNVSGTKFFAIKRIRKAVQKHSNMENFLLTTIASSQHLSRSFKVLETGGGAQLPDLRMYQREAWYTDDQACSKSYPKQKYKYFGEKLKREKN